MKNFCLIKVLFAFAFNMIFIMGAQSKTISVLVDEPIQELAYRCAQPVECQTKPQEQIVVLKAGDTYMNKDNEEVEVLEEGFLVLDRFVALKNVKESSNSSYYACDNSSEIIFENTDLTASEIAQNDKELFDFITNDLGKVCANFWAPKFVLDGLRPVPVGRVGTGNVLTAAPSTPPTNVFNNYYGGTRVPRDYNNRGLYYGGGGGSRNILNNNQVIIQNLFPPQPPLFNETPDNGVTPVTVVEEATITPVPIGGSMGLFGFLFPWNWF